MSLSTSENRIGYYDIETADWSAFVVGAWLPPGQSRPAFAWHRPETMLSEMAAHEGVVWRGHYAGRFDALLLLSIAARAGWRLDVSMRGASVIRARMRRPGARKTTITLEDTFALAPTGLAKFSKAAGLTQKGEWNHDRTKPGMRPGSPEGRELAEYLERDVLALRDADTAWRQVLREVAGVEPGLTLGGTAWKSAVALSPFGPGEDVTDPMPLVDYEEGRAGYYGGRVEVFRPRAETVWRYDRNSSYPAALTRQRVPWGRRRWQRTWDGEEGTVWATVRVPESRHPPLPHRCEGGRLVYPTGTVHGAWTAVELRRAVELGSRILRVHRARIADETTDALAAWCHRVWAARVERPAWGGLLKLLANSLTGKLAQKPERSTILFSHVDELPPEAELLTPPGPDGQVWSRRTVSYVAPCARPEWSAYLTAEARGELLSQLLHAGDASAYCDTDSVYSLAPLSRALGPDLGQWKVEGRADDWTALAPKLYRYRDDGSVKVRGRGLPGLTPDGFDALARLEGDWSVHSGVESLLSTLSRLGEAAFVRRTLTRGRRETPGRIGGRVWAGGESTRAPTVEEAESW